MRAPNNFTYSYMKNKYCFDLDNTLCYTDGREYAKSAPIKPRIDKVNHLFDSGHEIIIYTARGMGYFSGDVDRIEKEYRELTTKQLSEWGLKYHELKFGKPSYDLFIDDKAISPESFDTYSIPRLGFIAGSFDILHPGYIRMLEEAKNHCDKLFVALHLDPSDERPDKLRPILTYWERFEILKSIKYVDLIQSYRTEEELKMLLDSINPDVRFLGSDYLDKQYTIGSRDIPIVWINRDHGWSTTKLKNDIFEQIKSKNDRN